MLNIMHVDIVGRTVAARTAISVQETGSSTGLKKGHFGVLESFDFIPDHIDYGVTEMDHWVGRNDWWKGVVNLSRKV